jgi:hypothetical protein
MFEGLILYVLFMSLVDCAAGRALRGPPLCIHCRKCRDRQDNGMADTV